MAANVASGGSIEMASASIIDEMIKTILRAIVEYEGSQSGEIFPLGGVQSTLIEEGHDDALIGTAIDEMFQRGIIQSERKTFSMNL